MPVAWQCLPMMLYSWQAGTPCYPSFCLYHRPSTSHRVGIKMMDELLAKGWQAPWFTGKNIGFGVRRLDWCPHPSRHYLCDQGQAANLSIPFVREVQTGSIPRWLSPPYLVEGKASSPWHIIKDTPSGRLGLYPEDGFPLPTFGILPLEC